jgi:5-methylcytosine-specific restriction endonuclease McrA
MPMPTVTIEHAIKMILAKPRSRAYWLAGLATEQDRQLVIDQLALIRSQAEWVAQDDESWVLYLSGQLSGCLVRPMSNGVMWEAVIHGVSTVHRGSPRAKRYALSYGSTVEQRELAKELKEKASELLAKAAKRQKTGLCPVCFNRRPLTRDHWFPRSKGGSGAAANIVWMCGPCNQRKGNQMPSECAAWLPQDLAVGAWRAGWPRS